MNREVAIEILKEYRRYALREAITEALDLAIEALQGDLHCPKCGTIVRDGRQYHDLVYRGEAEKLQLSGETSTCKLKKDHDFLIKPDSDECKEQKSKLESDLISRQAAIEALMAHFMSQTYTGEQVEQAEKLAQKIMNALPPVEPKEQNEEDILKFYYVESLDEYWIGQRCGTRYYGKWTGNCFTFGYSRYLPWGEHVVAPDTLWKEYTYPSEPKEIPFNEWLQGFLEKECQPERTGITTDIAFSLHEEIRCEVLCTNPMRSDRGCDGGCQYDTELLKRIDEVIEKVIVDSPTERTGEWITEKGSMSGIDSLLWVLRYNGYEQQIKDIYEYIKQEEVTASYPHDLGILSDDADSPDRILWSTLVMEFGDYGTSPRFGWIDKTQRAIDCFEQFIAEGGLYDGR